MAHRRYGRALAAALILSNSIPNVEAANGWRVVTDLTLVETYNNNTGLAAAGAEQDDFITTVSPGLRIEADTPRLRVSFDYRPSLLLYARNTQEDQLINQLGAFGALEVLEKFFFIEATGTITQTYISPLGARPSDLTTVTPNRTETQTYSLSPYVRGVFGLGYNYELRNRNIWTRTDTDALGNVSSTYWNGRVMSPIRLFGWSLEGETSKIRQEDFTLQPDRESRLVRGRLFYQPDYAWRFFVSAGQEENNYEVLREMKSSSIYGVGATWAPSARTTAEAQYEERFFGPSRLARLQHRTRQTAWNISYSLGTSNFQEELLRLQPGSTAALVDSIFASRIPDPVQRRAAVEQFFRATGTPSFLTGSLAFYTTQIMLEERLEASAAIIGLRNSIAFTAFASDSERISEGLTGVVPDAFLLGERIQQTGFGVNASHRLGPFTSAGVSASRIYSRQAEPTPTFTTVNDSVTVSLNHSVSAKTTTFAGFGLTAVEDDFTNTTRKSQSAFVGLSHRF